MLNLSFDRTFVRNADVHCQLSRSQVLFGGVVFIPFGLIRLSWRGVFALKGQLESHSQM